MKIESPAKSEDVDFLMEGLSVEANAKRGLNPAKPVSFILYDDSSTKIGGILCYLVYGALHIDTLFVAKEFRGKGYGRKLVEMVEESAREYGCTFSWLGTMDFEAEPFYRRLGYEKVIRVDGYSNNSYLTYFKKPL